MAKNALDRSKETSEFAVAGQSGEHSGVKDDQIGDLARSVSVAQRGMGPNKLRLLDEFVKVSGSFVKPTLSDQITRLNKSDFDQWKRAWRMLQYAVEFPDSDDDDDGGSQSVDTPSSTTLDHDYKWIKSHRAHSASDSIDARDDEPTEEPTNSEPLNESTKQSKSTDEGDAQIFGLDDKDKTLIEDQIRVLQDKDTLTKLLDGPGIGAYYPRERAMSIDNGVLERWVWEGEPWRWPGLKEGKVEFSSKGEN